MSQSFEKTKNKQYLYSFENKYKKKQKKKKQCFISLWEKDGGERRRGVAVEVRPCRCGGVIHHQSR